MQKIKLDERLSAVAAFARNGKSVADIGTDHGYIPAYLVQNGIAPLAIAADLREQPLENASQTIRSCELEDKIKTVLSDGLDSIPAESCDDIVIAGMGGILIREILERTPWILDSRYRLILQPMSHQEQVRAFLYSSGFEIVGEMCTEDGKHSYCTIAAEYREEKTALTPAMIYVGTLGNKSDESSLTYLQKQLSRLEKRLGALKSCGGDKAEIAELEAVITDFSRLWTARRVTVGMISQFINSFAPYETMCEWDNCGVLTGDKDASVQRVAFCLDLTTETLALAIEEKADLVITHHPIIFNAQKSFLKGNMAFELARHGINAISAHTCFDCANGGVNDVLCELLSLKNCIAVESEGCKVPMVRMGEVPFCTPNELAKSVASVLSTTVRLVDCKNKIKKVALCGGAGMSFLDDVLSAGADAYVTGDISHHEMLEAKERGLTVVAAGHFETEAPSMAALCKKVGEFFPSLHTVLLKQSNPISFVGVSDCDN